MVRLAWLDNALTLEVVFTTYSSTDDTKTIESSFGFLFFF